MGRAWAAQREDAIATLFNFDEATLACGHRNLETWSLCLDPDASASAYRTENTRDG